MHVNKRLMNKIEACEMCFPRRMGKISWKQKMKMNICSKEFVKTENNKKETKIFRPQQTSRLNYEGKMKGKRPLDKPRASCDNMEWSGHS